MQFHAEESVVISGEGCGMNMGRVILSGVALALTGLVTAAKADVIETGSIGLQNVANYSGAGLSIALPQYNLGTDSLLGVRITVTTSAVANISVQNNNMQNAYNFQNATAAAVIELTGPASYMNFISTVATLASGIAYANQATDYPGVTGSGGLVIDVASAALSAYEGSGNLVLTFSAPFGNASYSGIAVNAGSNTVYFGGGDNLGVDVVLDYETVPEPATFAVLGTGLAATASFRRRRKRA